MMLRITINCDNPPALAQLLTNYAATIKDGDIRNEYLRDIKGNCVGEVEILADDDAEAESPPVVKGRLPRRFLPIGHPDK